MSRPVTELKDKYDVIVVGSGYGGAIAASRLSRARRTVCVLERGRELQPGEFPDTGPELIAQMQVDSSAGRMGDPAGLFDLRLNTDVSVLVGCGLGGTSLINANVSTKPDPRVFQDERWPMALREDVSGNLEIGYRRAAEMLRPQPYSGPPLRKLESLRKAAEAFGRHVDLPSLSISFEAPREGLNLFGVPQSACVLCGDCVTGCNHRAKNTVLMNYLPDAKAHGAEIYTQCRVHHLSRSGERWCVHFEALNTGQGHFEGRPFFVSAEVVVLAAGTLGSTEILLRSRELGLSLSNTIGKRFTGNGDAMGFAYNGSGVIDGVGQGAHNGDVVTTEEPTVGPCITGMIDLRDSAELEDGLIIQDGAIPGALASFISPVFATAAKLVGKAPAAAPDSWMATTLREASSLLWGAHSGAMRNTQTLLAMGHDDGRGELVLEDDRVRVRWPDAGQQPVFRKINHALRKASELAGATYVEDPISARLVPEDLITVHPLGGCVMAESASAGAVNHKGQVFSGVAGTDVHPGLYVCDGAIIPRPLGVNPLLTISALAEREVSLLAADRGWTIDYALPPTPPSAAPLLQPLPEPPLTLEFTERMVGPFSLDGPDRREETLELILTISNGDLDALVTDTSRPSSVVGTASCRALSASPLSVRDGRFILLAPDPQSADTRRMIYEMSLVSQEGERFHFYGVKILHSDRAGLDAWSDTTTLNVTIRKGSSEGAIRGRGTLRICLSDFAKQLQTVRVGNARNMLERIEALARFGRAFAGDLWNVYGGVLKPSSTLAKNAPARKRRMLRAPTPELHRFLTEDGVTLQLTRYPGGAKGPVLLSHGLGVSGRIFSLDTIETNLVEYLCAHGFDVWNLENRASIELRSSQFGFTLDDAAAYDYSAAISIITATTGRSSVQAVAHCFGGTTLSMALLRGLRGIRSAVISQVSTHVEVGFHGALKTGLHVPDLLNLLGVDSLSAYAGKEKNWSEKLFEHALRLIPVDKDDRCENPVCRRIWFMYAPLYHHAQLSAATHDSLHELFGVANVRAFDHLAEMVRHHHAVSAQGEDVYLSNPAGMKIPIAFIHGANNLLYSPSSTLNTLRWLTQANGPLYSRQEIPGYRHIDCLIGKNASADVFPIILKHLLTTQ